MDHGQRAIEMAIRAALVDAEGPEDVKRGITDRLPLVTVHGIRVDWCSSYRHARVIVGADRASDIHVSASVAVPGPKRR